MPAGSKVTDRRMSGYMSSAREIPMCSTTSRSPCRQRLAPVRHECHGPPFGEHGRNSPDFKRGKRAYDGILIAEIIPVAAAKFESYSDRNAKEALLAGQVNPLVKIFPDTVPAEGRPLSVSLARNEAEGLQLAVRSRLAYPSLTVSVSAPKNAAGQSCRHRSPV